MSAPTAISSGVLTPGTTTLFTGKQYLNSVILQPTAVVTIYDNTSAAGTVLFLVTNAGTSTLVVPFNRAIRADIGLTVVVATANAIVHYGAA